ncbi:myeloid differentiation primary response protein MyD88 [Helicoverpa armigera]|uniref:myeloid differentiation primary response protein MyD88 n=1 Tax=Helicoverpa armigera TaxID=29058 RepID=UPI0030833640
MGDDTDIKSLPLSCLPSKTRELLSCLLDTPKIIPNDGPVKLPRDWRGLAYLVNVSAEKAEYIKLQPQKTTEILQIWQKDHTATVGQLLSYLELLDRYDVYDDLCDDLKESIKRREIIVNRQNQIAINNNNNDDQKVFSAITYDDAPGYEQHYDAFILYAKEDKHFVDELINRMTAAGFQLCTEDRLQAGHMTPYAPVAQLISERCKRIILVCSPEFLSSQANTFYRDYAQAVSIESSHHKIIPIMYRECQLPSHLAFYHKLYYNELEDRALYDFWLKLRQSLELARAAPTPRIANRMNGNTIATSMPQIKIVELPSSKTCNEYLDDNHLFLPSASKSISMNELDSLNVHTLTADCNSLSSVSQKSVSSVKKKKKPKIINWFLKHLKISKTEEAIMVAT